MAPSFFANPNDIQRSVNGLCDKFIYHGLITQSNYLRQLADNFLKSTTSNYDLQNRLNIIQFLICMSDKPTDKAIGYMPLSLQQVEDDITDWASYLLPEELKWKPPADDTDEVCSYYQNIINSMLDVIFFRVGMIYFLVMMR